MLRLENPGLRRARLRGQLKLAVSLATTLLICTPPIAAAETTVVYTQDFAGGYRPLPPEWSSGTGRFGDYAGDLGIPALVNNSTGDPAPASVLVLSGLGPHTSLNIGFLFDALGSWDGLGPGYPENDFFNVSVDGVPVFSEAFAIASGSQSYVPPPGVQLSTRTFDMAQEPRFNAIPHTAQTATIAWFASGVGWQGGSDEWWAIAHVVVSTNIETPAIAGVSPTSAFEGDTISFTGYGLDSVASVTFGSVPAQIALSTSHLLKAVVPALAKSGMVLIVRPSVVLQFSGFTVLPRPVLARVVPDRARPRMPVHVYGRYLSDVASVWFGNSRATFTAQSDTELVAYVSWAGTSGKIRADGSLSNVSSSFDFTILSPQPAPMLAGVSDVPRDQGGKVFVYWQRSDYDFDPSDNLGAERLNYGSPQPIARYRIWRRMPAISPVICAQVPRQDYEPACQTAARSRPAAGAMLDYWELVGELPARCLDGYAYTASTTQDSLPGSNPFTAYFVEADGEHFYDSAPDSGYSVDNLAPAAPSPFIAQYSDHGVTLHWVPSRATDFSVYWLYRGGNPDFTPSPINLVTAQPDTGFFDAGGTARSYYKLAAVDVHGNVGRYAIVTPTGATATLATFLSPDVTGSRIRLGWYLSTDQPFTVTLYRRATGDGWRSLGTLTPDGQGYVRYEDTDLVGGGRYQYRLGLGASDGSELFAGDGWVNVPLAAEDATVRALNPVFDGDVTVSFAASAGHTVRVELFDLSGRLLAAQIVQGGMGRQTTHLASSSSLAPGLYLVRVGLEKPVTTRIAVIR